MSYINSIQTFAVTIGASGTSNTATITSVNTSNAVIFFGGFSSAETSTTYESFAARAELTNATTVTAYRDTSTSNTITVYGTVVEFTSAAIASVQAGTITIATSATSGTATISSVSTSNSAVFYLGFTCHGVINSSANCCPAIALTNATTVTASRNTSSSGESVTVGYCVVNFASGVVNSVQPMTATLTTANASDTQTISSVNTGNALVLYNGVLTSTTSYDVFFYNLQLTNSTTVTLSRGGTATSSRTIYYTVLEFVSGVVNGIQRGTVTMTNVTSNDATISSVNTSQSVCNWTGFSSSLVSNNPAEAFSAAYLNSSTDVHVVVHATASGVTSVVGYEVIQFTSGTALTIDFGVLSELLSSPKGDGPACAESRSTQTADGPAPAESPATARTDSPTGTETNGFLLADSGLRDETPAAPSTDTPVPGESPRAVRSDGVPLVEALAAVPADPGGRSEWTGTIPADDPVPGEWPGSVRADRYGPPEALVGGRVDVLTRLEYPLSQRVDGVHPVEWTGVVLLTADALVPVEWTSTQAAERPAPGSAAVIVSLDRGAPAEVLCSPPADAGFGLEGLGALRPDLLSRSETTGRFVLDRPHPLEHGAGTVTDRPGTTEALSTVPRGGVSAFECLALSRTDGPTPGEFRLVIKADTAVADETLLTTLSVVLDRLLPFEVLATSRRDDRPSADFVVLLDLDAILASEFASTPEPPGPANRKITVGRENRTLAVTLDGRRIVVRDNRLTVVPGADGSD